MCEYRQRFWSATGADGTPPPDYTEPTRNRAKLEMPDTPRVMFVLCPNGPNKVSVVSQSDQAALRTELQRTSQREIEPVSHLIAHHAIGPAER